jgi:predicted N-acetyltransferase YhbS
MKIRAEKPSDLANIVKLHEEAFGPGRFAKTAYRLREGASPAPGLSLVALDGARLVGSVRFTAIKTGEKRGALLLGPLAVYKDYSGNRCGLRLMRKGLELAAEKGYELVLLVGVEAYYRKVGFVRVEKGRISLPGPVDYDRLLARELKPGALARFHGVARALFDEENNESS